MSARARSLEYEFVAFAQVRDISLTKLLRAISSANRDLHWHLTRIISKNPARIPRSPVQNVLSPMYGSNALEEAHSRISEQQVNPSQSSKRLEAINKALHSTWPHHHHQICSSHTESTKTLWGRWKDTCSARLRIDHTWKDSKEDRRHFDVLLHASNDEFRQIRVEIDEAQDG